jgi:hypothetical protein
MYLTQPPCRDLRTVFFEWYIKDESGNSLLPCEGSCSASEEDGVTLGALVDKVLEKAENIPRTTRTRI